MNPPLFYITCLLLLLNSCSSPNVGLGDVARAKVQSDLELENVEVSQYPESPEEGVAYAKADAHPHEIRVTRGAVYYAHYFDSDGRLRKTERTVDGKVEIITHN